MVCELNLWPGEWKRSDHRLGLATVHCLCKLMCRTLIGRLTADGIVLPLGDTYPTSELKGYLHSMRWLSRLTVLGKWGDPDWYGSRWRNARMRTV